MIDLPSQIEEEEYKQDLYPHLYALIQSIVHGNSSVYDILVHLPLPILTQEGMNTLLQGKIKLLLEHQEYIPLTVPRMQKLVLSHLSPLSNSNSSNTNTREYNQLQTFLCHLIGQSCSHLYSSSQLSSLFLYLEGLYSFIRDRDTPSLSPDTYCAAVSSIGSIGSLAPPCRSLSLEYLHHLHTHSLSSSQWIVPHSRINLYLNLLQLSPALAHIAHSPSPLGYSYSCRKT